MDNRNEIRTACYLMRAGAGRSGAGARGLHHAAVIRHIDALATLPAFPDERAPDWSRA